LHSFLVCHLPEIGFTGIQVNGTHCILVFNLFICCCIWW